MTYLDSQHRNPEDSVDRVSRSSARALGLVVSGLVLLTVLLVTVLLGGSGPVKAQGATTISLDPTPLALAVDGTGAVDVMVGDFASPGGLGAYILAISYDSSVVVVTSVEGGDPPFAGGTPDVGNETGGGPVSMVDNEAGKVEFAAFQASQATGPVGDFRIARVNFQAVGESGATSDLTVQVVDLVDAQSGVSVPATPANGMVVLDGNPSDVRGKTTLQFRASTGGRALVEISCPSLTASTVPAEDGTWRFADVPEETCGLTATAPGYLTAEGTFTKGPTALAVPANELLGGDATGDGVVALVDITGMIARFTQSTADCQIDGSVVDVNCDGVVALNDITSAIINFAKSSQPFPTE